MRIPRRLWLLVLVSSAAACSNDGAATEPAHHTLVAVGGDRQAGPPSQPLVTPLAVQVVDKLGRSVGNTTVHWSTDGAGHLAPDASLTDADGVARTLWTLGPGSGEQRTTAAEHDSPGLTFLARALTREQALEMPLTVLSLETPDGSGQTVHPDYVSTPAPWRAAERYLVLTPYPNGNEEFENPSLFAGGDAVTWAPPSGITNPIATTGSGYLSDPDAVYLPEANELRIYYRAVDAHNVTRMIASRDGVTFSPPVTVAEGINHSIVSPAVVRRSPTEWLMWSINAGMGCEAPTTAVEIRRSSNGINWSAPSAVSLSQPGSFAWHIDVQWIPSRNEYWALYNTKAAGRCSTPALFLATSADGIAWRSYPSPVLSAGAIPAFADIVYRSTFAYDATTDEIDFWYSGARYVSPNFVWSTAHERRSRRAVFAQIETPASGALFSRAPRSGVPPLVNPP